MQKIKTLDQIEKLLTKTKKKDVDTFYNEDSYEFDMHAGDWPSFVLVNSKDNNFGAHRCREEFFDQFCNLETKKQLEFFQDKKAELLFVYQFQSSRFSNLKKRDIARAIKTAHSLLYKAEKELKLAKHSFEVVNWNIVKKCGGSGIYCGNYHRNNCICVGNSYIAIKFKVSMDWFFSGPMVYLLLEIIRDSLQLKEKNLAKDKYFTFAKKVGHKKTTLGISLKKLCILDSVGSQGSRFYYRMGKGQYIHNISKRVKKEIGVT